MIDINGKDNPPFVCDNPNENNYPINITEFDIVEDNCCTHVGNAPLIAIKDLVNKKYNNIHAFYADIKYDDGFVITKFEWIIKDRNKNTEIIFTKRDMNVEYTFASPGFKNVTLKVYFYKLGHENNIQTTSVEKVVEIFENKFLNIPAIDIDIKEVYKRNFIFSLINFDFYDSLKDYNLKIFMENPAYLTEPCIDDITENSNLPICTIDNDKFSPDKINIIDYKNIYRAFNKYICIARPRKIYLYNTRFF